MAHFAFYFLAFLLACVSQIAVASPFVGDVRWYAGLSPPAGWLFCNGSAVSRTDYASLFQALGTAFGNGDGLMTFNLPDFSGRVSIGEGSGSSLTSRSFGQMLGAEKHALLLNELPSHNHGGATAFANPEHSHGFNFPLYSTSGSTDTGRINAWTGKGDIRGWVRQSTGGASGSMDHDHVIYSQGSSAAHNIMQPSLVLGYIIRFASIKTCQLLNCGENSVWYVFLFRRKCL